MTIMLNVKFPANWVFQRFPWVFWEFFDWVLILFEFFFQMRSDKPDIALQEECHHNDESVPYLLPRQIFPVELSKQSHCWQGFFDFESLDQGLAICLSDLDPRFSVVFRCGRGYWGGSSWRCGWRRRQSSLSGFLLFFGRAVSCYLGLDAFFGLHTDSHNMMENLKHYKKGSNFYTCLLSFEFLSPSFLGNFLHLLLFQLGLETCDGFSLLDLPIPLPIRAILVAAGYNKYNALEDRREGSENPGSRSHLRIWIGI